MGSFRIGGAYDYGLPSVSSPDWVHKPEVVTWGYDTPGAQLSSAPVVITDCTPAITGAVPRKSGGTTGWTCGTIVDVDVDAPVTIGSNPGYRLNAIIVEICVLAGDSGGAAVTGQIALGVTSGSNAGNDCGDGLVGSPDPEPVTELGVFAPVYSTSFESAQTLDSVGWEPTVQVDLPFILGASRVGHVVAHKGCDHGRVGGDRGGSRIRC